MGIVGQRIKAFCFGQGCLASGLSASAIDPNDSIAKCSGFAFAIVIHKRSQMYLCSHYHLGIMCVHILYIVRLLFGHPIPFGNLFLTVHLRSVHGRRLEERRELALHSQPLAKEPETYRNGDQTNSNAAKKCRRPLNAHAFVHLAREQRETCCDHRAAECVCGDG